MKDAVTQFGCLTVLSWQDPLPFWERSPTFRQAPLAQHPVGAKRSGVGCVGSGRGIPYRILFCPLTPYNFATKWRTFPREARCIVRSLPARDWAASRLFMVTFVVADLTLDFCKEYRAKSGASTLTSANSGCLVE